eukprot:c26094_g1_i1 orf=542-1570(-)
MPVVEKDAMVSNATLNAVAYSRKEKKKQAKEERDRLKQVEKKKRRLEKALATATAIRIELEKKKQKRKEEEQRLDEEGAALAEAVALQVLVDEDADADTVGENGNSLESKKFAGNEDIEGFNVVKEDRMPPGLESFMSTKSLPFQSFELQQHFNYVYPMIAQNQRSFPNMDFLHGWDDKLGNYKKLQGEMSEWEIFGSAEDKLKLCKQRANAAEIAAEIAAAQAVAALHIAEEARAEAEAAKKVAEEAMSRVLDKNDFTKCQEHVLQVHVQDESIKMERGELRAQLEETECQHKEKRKFCLEKNLENVSQHLFEFKATHPFSVTGLAVEGKTSKKDRTIAES